MRMNNIPEIDRASPSNAEGAPLPDRQKDSQRNKARHKSIVEAAASGVLSKGMVLVVSAISVPITVRYLGVEQYGIWITISTTMAMLAVMDLGIANTLTNLISEAFAKDSRELAGKYAATAFWMMVLVAVGLGIAGWIAWPHLNWGYVFHVEGGQLGDATSKAVAAAFVVFLIGLPAGLATKLLGGYQEQRTANVFATIGSLLSLLAIVLVVWLHGSLPVLVAGYAGAMVAANALCLLWLWSWHKPWLTPLPRRLDPSLARSIMQSGGLFFVLQLSGLVVFNSDNLVIAHFLSPADVTPYSVTWRIVSYAAVLQTLMTPALWPAYSEAFVRRDGAWIQKTYWRVMKLTMGVTAAFCVLFILFGRTIIRYWAGAAAVPPASLIVAMCAWILICTLMNNESCLLVAANEIRLQAWAGVIAAIVNLAATIWMVQRIGVLGVIMGTIFSYLLVLVGPQTWKVAQVLRQTRATQPVSGVIG